MDAPAELLRAARSALGLSQDQVAEISGISARTILRIEREGHVKVETMRQVQKAFEELGIQFTDEGDGFGHGMRMPKKSSCS